MSKKEGGPAFPSVQVIDFKKAGEAEWIEMPFTGLTKREWFAGIAMKAILSNPELIDTRSDNGVNWVKEYAYQQADAMLAEGEKS